MKGKLIDISTDGVHNMAGRHTGAVTRPAKGTLPGFFREWYAAHQLDPVVHEFILELCGETFYRTSHHTLFSINSNLVYWSPALGIEFGVGNEEDLPEWGLT